MSMRRPRRSSGRSGRDRGPSSATDSPSAGTRASKPRSRPMRAASASAASSSPWVTKTARGGFPTEESQRIISPASAWPGEALEVAHLGEHRHVALVDAHDVGAVEERAPERTRGLVAGDEQRVLGVGQPHAAVVQDPSAREHAARGDDDRRPLHVVEGLRLGARAVERDPPAVEQAAPADVVEAHPAAPRGGRRRCASRRSPSASRRGSGTAGCGPASRARPSARSSAARGPPRTPGSAARRPRAKVRLRTPSSWSRTGSVRVRAVAVRALDDEVVRLRRGRRVLGEDGVVAADVAAEEDARRRRRSPAP